MTHAGWLVTILLLVASFGCTKHTVQVEPIKVEPIHITVDVNLRVDRELDNFFDFEDDLRPPKDEEGGS
jgi:hypothetical protein